MSGIVEFFLLGKLLMFLARKSPYFKRGFLKELFDCELCSGVWVYTILAFIFRVSFVDTQVLLSAFITGSIASFLMWVFTAGWNTLFRDIHISME
jgi:hypothetical protein